MSQKIKRQAEHIQRSFACIKPTSKDAAWCKTGSCHGPKKSRKGLERGDDVNQYKKITYYQNRVVADVEALSKPHPLNALEQNSQNGTYHQTQRVSLIGDTGITILNMAKRMPV